MQVTTITVLDISTAHLSPETAQILENTPLNDWPVAGGNTQFGFFLYAHDDNDGAIPQDLWACMEFARKHHCCYLYFDRDADQYDDLPTYDW